MVIRCRLQYKRGVSVCLFVCLSWAQWFVYVFEVIMINIIVKAVQRQVYTYVRIPNKRIIYARRVFMCRSELQGLVNI